MSDLDDEIRSHLEHEIDDNVARGMTRVEAEAAAYRKFGNRTRVKEDVWRLRPWAWLDGLRQDLRYALRMMRKNWGFTAIAVASLALGIGGNTALFSLVDRLLRTLAVREPERLVQLTATRRANTRGHSFFTYSDYEVLRTLEFFDGLPGWNNREVEVEWNGVKRKRAVTLVTGDYFPTLGVQPMIGRLLDTQDDSPAGGDAAVITYALWEREFQLKPSVLGERFRWERGLFTVVGVLSPAFRGLELDVTPEIFLTTHSLPVMGDKGKLKDTGSPNLLTLKARLKPGVTPEQVASVLQERWPKMAQHGRPPPDGFTSKLTLTPGYAGFSRLQNQFSYGLWILLGLSGVVLAAACANLASLQLLRADARRREMSIRAAAGATTGRIVRQWFTESLLLSAAGGLAGLIASQWITSGLLLFLPEAQRAFYAFALDGRVLVVSLAATVVTALIFGVLPGWQAAREAYWKEAGRGSVGPKSTRWVQGAMALQLAASLVLILGAALFARSLGNLVTADYGFNRQGLVVARLNWDERMPSKWHFDRNMALLEQVRNLPQVKAAAFVEALPLSPHVFGALRVVGYVPAPGETTTMYFNAVRPGYFALMGIPLLAGRDFEDRDLSGPKIVIVSESLARHYFGRVDAIGEKITWGENNRDIPIVGVVGNYAVIDAREGAQDVLYTRSPGIYARVIARPRPGVKPAALIAAIRPLASRPEIKGVLEVTEYAAMFDRSMQQDRLLAILAAVFGVLGAGLALIGLYGSMAYTVSRRNAELGIRMALGARPAQIARMVVRETSALAALGLLLGIPLGALASRLVAARLFQVQPFDPIAIAAVALVMLVVSLAAALGPAWRAARVDAAVALRAE